MTEQSAPNPACPPVAENPDLHSLTTCTPSQTPNSEDWRPLVVFQARGLDFFWILLRNLVFTILTLGIYAFWAKVRRRAFLWSSTRILGEPLEYTGTGKELFISFLIVMGCFVLLALVQTLLVLLHPLAGLVLYVGLLYAIHFASYRTIRYRLTRTRWRGIRGNLDGSAARYALKAFGYTLAVVGTLGILGPWCTSNLVSLQINNAFLGTRRLSFNGPPRELYFAYFITLFAIIGLLGAGAVIIYYNLQDVMQTVKQAADASDPHFNAAFFTIAGVSAVLSVALTLVGAIYQAAFARWYFGHLSFGAMQLRSTLTAGALAKLYLVNMLLLVFTLGIAYPWVCLRTLSVPLNRIDYKGDPDLGRLFQDVMPAPKRGEGLLEALDIDIAM